MKKVFDKRLEFVKNISLEKSRVNLCSPLIFLCGGEVDVQADSFMSVRSALVSHFNSVGCAHASSLILAESYKDWLNDGLYEDLMSFEDDIASISSLVVLILESPGALAELGLFCVNENLIGALLVFVQEGHFQNESFIKLGPLRYLESYDPSSVCVYPWNEKDLRGTLPRWLPQMRAAILSFLQGMSRSEAFNSCNRGHQAFLIYEIVKVFRALKFGEVKEYLSALGVNVSAPELKKLFFLLGKFDLVGSVRRGGNQVYYFPRRNIDKLKFGGRFDATAAYVLAMQFYFHAEDDVSRQSVVEEVNRSFLGGEADAPGSGGVNYGRD